MNIINLPDTFDITKTYSKVYRETDFDDFKSFYYKVERSDFKLNSCLFRHKDVLYTTKNKRYDLSIRTEDEDLKISFVVNRVFKFKWKYVPIDKIRRKDGKN